ncbi:MAG: hypothetical protein M0017_05775 [Desulfobacteraceae bacterium]|nr:hypothetical protein [Desulfobacteraceae bacterium]
MDPRFYMFDLEGIFLWGFVATLLLSTILELSQGLGLSRMSLPFMLGTMLTANRHRAQMVGYLLHFTLGLPVTFFYALIFESLHLATWWLGAFMGLLQGLITLVIPLPLLPHFHPRMASEYDGPSPTRMLEPPGFLCLNYGRRTPLTTLFAYLVFGLIMGAFYQVGR